MLSRHALRLRHCGRTFHSSSSALPRARSLATTLIPTSTAGQASLLHSSAARLSDGSPVPEVTGQGHEGREERLFKRVDIELRAHQPAVLKSYSWFMTEVANNLDVAVEVSEGEEEPHKVRKTLLKSIFVHSKHRVQYEMRTYYWVFQLGRMTESTRDTYLEYVQRNLPEGVSMKVTEHEYLRLPDNVLKTMAKEQS